MCPLVVLFPHAGHMFQQGEDDTKCQKNGMQGKENKTQIKIPV